MLYYITPQNLNQKRFEKFTVGSNAYYYLRRDKLLEEIDSWSSQNSMDVAFCYDSVSPGEYKGTFYFKHEKDLTIFTLTWADKCEAASKNSPYIAKVRVMDALAKNTDPNVQTIAKILNSLWNEKTK